MSGDLRLSRGDAAKALKADDVPAGVAGPTRRSASGGGRARLVFILSAERSGSTLLSLMLGAHSRIVAPPELHLLAYPTFEVWQQQYPAAMRSLCFLLEACGLPADEPDVAQRFAGWPTVEVYEWLLERGLTPAQILVGKTPKYARDLTILRRTATLAPCYIWLIRHPLGVAASQLDLRLERRRGRNTRLLPRLKYPLFCLWAALGKRAEVERQVAYWVRINTHIHEFLGTIARHRQQQVQFERLVAEPRAVMECLCLWLGIEFESAMMEPREHIPEAMHPALGDPKVYRHTAIDPNVAYAWRRRFSERLLDASTRELMTRWEVA